MTILIKIIYGILLIAAGVGIIKYRRDVKSWVGNNAWAEKNLGRGSTYGIIIMIGLFMIFLGTLYPFGGLELIFGPNRAPTP